MKRNELKYIMHIQYGYVRAEIAEMKHVLHERISSIAAKPI